MPTDKLDKLKPAFLKRVKALKDQGKSETEIAETLDLSVAELRQAKQRAQVQFGKNIRKQLIELQDKGYSVEGMAHELGLKESTVRNILDPK